MSYKLTITQKPTHVHAIITGTNTREDVARYLEELQRECIARSCARVLIEERLEGHRIGTTDVFQIISEASARARGIFEAIAYVDVNAESGQNMKFGETVAVNRGVPARVFLAVVDAEKWLVGEVRGGMQPGAPAEAKEPRR
jgi:hypothetical protein